MSRSRATLAKVAAAAGVSKSQASDALRGSGRVSDETRQRVLAAAKQLQYRANSNARSLRSGSSSLIALHFDPASAKDANDAFLPFWSTFLAAFAGTIESYGFHTILDTSSPHEDLFELPASAVVLLSTDDITIDVPRSSAFGRVISFFGSRRESAIEHDTLIDFHHDYQAIASDIADRFVAAGSRSVVMIRRPGTHFYQDLVEESLANELTRAGIAFAARDFDGSNAGQFALVTETLAGRDVDGFLNFGSRLPALVAGINAQEKAASEDASQGVVVVTQADSLGDLINLGPITLLRLDAQGMGVALAEHVVAAVSGRSVDIVPFDYELVTVTT